MATADVMYDEANKLKEQGELEAAVTKLLEIVEATPEHVISHSALGLYLQKLGRNGRSLQARQTSDRTRAKRSIQLHTTFCCLPTVRNDSRSRRRNGKSQSHSKWWCRGVAAAADVVAARRM